jgi:DNA repair exonuclease SbcCD ATPase subunit
MLLRDYSNSLITYPHCHNRLTQLPLEADIKGLRSQANNLQQQLQEARLSVIELGIDERLEQVGNAITSLERKSQEFLTRPELTPWQQTMVDRLEHSIADLKTELDGLNDALTERLEQSSVQQSEEVRQQIQDVEAWLKDLDTSFEALHDRTRVLDSMQCQIEQLMVSTGRVSELETTLAALSQELVGQVDGTVDKRIAEINELLQKIKPDYEYRLVYDRNQSREILFEAVKQAQHRLILVCPWPHWGIRWNEDELLKSLRAFLDITKGQLDIGWGICRI